MAYKAPIWEDGKSPAISAENLNNLSQAAEGAQVLYGNSAPTSSTEGAVGQFYLVVVPDSDGNYPLYQCVAIANGSYTWRDTRRIPDSITSMLGIPAPGTINRALNVLANVGNLHVWERVQTYTDPVPEVPAGYTLGDEQSVVAVGTADSSGYYCRIYYADSVTVSSDGVVSLSSPSNQRNRIYDWSGSSTLAGKYCLMGEYDGSTNLVKPTENGGVVFYVPSGGTIAYNESTKQITISKYQSVTGYPYTPAIPAGTTIDYLTSTDRNAYPDQSAEGGQDAYYTLGDVVSGTFPFIIGYSSAKIEYSNGVIVLDDGTVVLDSPNTAEGTTVSSISLPGKFFRRSVIDSDETDRLNVDFADTSAIFYVPEDATQSSKIYSQNTWYTISAYQPVTGHAAIPANNTITYLGRLGGGARIEVGSYVGTGTYGESNPNTITFDFAPKLVWIIGPSNGSFDVTNTPVLLIYDRTFYYNGNIDNTTGTLNLGVTWGDKFVSYYYKSGFNGYEAVAQLNANGKTYSYIAIG